MWLRPWWLNLAGIGTWQHTSLSSVEMKGLKKFSAQMDHAPTCDGSSRAQLGQVAFHGRRNVS